MLCYAENGQCAHFVEILLVRLKFAFTTLSQLENVKQFQDPPFCTGEISKHNLFPLRIFTHNN